MVVKWLPQLTIFINYNSFTNETSGTPNQQCGQPQKKETERDRKEHGKYMTYRSVIASLLPKISEPKFELLNNLTSAAQTSIEVSF